MSLACPPLRLLPNLSSILHVLGTSRRQAISVGTEAVLTGQRLVGRVYRGHVFLLPLSHGGSILPGTVFILVRLRLIVDGPA